MSYRVEVKKKIWRRHEFQLLTAEETTGESEAGTDCLPNDVDIKIPQFDSAPTDTMEMRTDSAEDSEMNASDCVTEER